LARKGWPGGGLLDVLEKGVDWCASEEPVRVGGRGVTSADGTGQAVSGVGGGEGSKLFSILPPKSILADAASDGSHNRADSLMVDTERYQSLAGAVSDPASLVTRDRERTERDRDADSVFSEFNRPRGVRPFSPQPQPLRLNPEALLGGMESDDTAQSSAADTPPEEKKTIPQQPRMSEQDEEEMERCRIEEETDDEEAHPWRNEGLKNDEEEDEDNRVGASLNDLEDARQRDDGSWSLAERP
jgi:hypothetical protein